MSTPKVSPAIIEHLTEHLEDPRRSDVISNAKTQAIANIKEKSFDLDAWIVIVCDVIPQAAVFFSRTVVALKPV